jgi:hypothetical protein
MPTAADWYAKRDAYFGKKKSGGSSFAKGAERSLKTADRALAAQERLANVLAAAAQEQMTYAKGKAAQLTSLAMDELGYSKEDRAASEKYMQQAEEEYAQYDEEFKARKALFEEQYEPIEARGRELAMKAGEFDEGQVGIARAEASGRSQAMLQNVREYMSSMGLSLESGRAAGLMKEYASEAAKGEAQAANIARRGERQRQLTSGLSAVQAVGEQGRRGYESDIAAGRYKLQHADTLRGIGERRRGASEAGRGRAMGGITTAANLPTSGLSALTTAAGQAGQTTRTATDLFGTQSDLAVRSAEAQAGLTGGQRSQRQPKFTLTTTDWSTATPLSELARIGR